jgi:uncharacterized protein YegL
MQNTKGNRMKGFEQVTIQDARPLPVIILADTSGSMQENGKIEALNLALKDMLLSFGQQSSLGAEIHVGVITFGGEVKCLHPPMPACQFEPQTMGELTADGGTPFGKAIRLVKELLEDKNTIPSRSYRPMIVAISDGYPTDAWELALEEFFKSERASKTIRVAMAIGPDADEAMLKKFVNDPAIPVVRAKDARDIGKFFKCVTMSVSQRSVQANPNQVGCEEIKQLFDEEDLEF